MSSLSLLLGCPDHASFSRACAYCERIKIRLILRSIRGGLLAAERAIDLGNFEKAASKIYAERLNAEQLMEFLSDGAELDSVD